MLLTIVKTYVFIYIIQSNNTFDPQVQTRSNYLPEIGPHSKLKIKVLLLIQKMMTDRPKKNLSSLMNQYINPSALNPKMLFGIMT